MKYAIFLMVNPIHLANITLDIVRYLLFFTHNPHACMDFIVNKPSYFSAMMYKIKIKERLSIYLRDIQTIKSKLEHPSHLYQSVQ